jgi:16S rRNA U516 pseudouridylate synthase RsuA-like enzyme
MIDTFIIPKDEAIIALDLASASISQRFESGITLSNNPNYLKLKNIYSFNQINSKFASLILQHSKEEGIRQMLEKQSFHIRQLATETNSIDLSIHQLTEEE